MVIKHRKLFPNQTQEDCYGFCDPSCPYNCYPSQDYYFSPPPPSISSSHSDQANHISSYLIILVTLFAVIFVVIGFYVIKVKCYAAWCGWRFSGSIPSDANEDFLNENQVDHPVWLIATVGLQHSIINSITVCKYKRDEGLVEGTECSVCLNEFQEEEMLRLLPKCNHAFHIPCIDTWLRSHTNCPLCRASIVSNSVSVTPEAVVSNLGSIEQENANLVRNQETLMENSRNNEGGFSSNMVENRTSTGESSEALELDESSSKERVNDSIQNHHVVDNVMHDDSKFNKVYHAKTCKAMRRSSIEECLHLSPVSMKRSFSCNGRILSSRGYMSLYSKLNSSLLELWLYER